MTELDLLWKDIFGRHGLKFEDSSIVGWPTQRNSWKYTVTHEEEETNTQYFIYHDDMEKFSKNKCSIEHWRKVKGVMADRCVSQ